MGAVEGRKTLTDAAAGQELGPIDVTVDRQAADRFLRRTAYASQFLAPEGRGGELVPPGALSNAYADLLEHEGFYFLNALHARSEEEFVRPVFVDEPLTCSGRIADAGRTRSGLVYVEIEAEVSDATEAVVLRTVNRLVVETGA